MQHNSINNKSSIISGLFNINININEKSKSGINSDPIRPIIVFFGLICSHNFCLPKNLPTKYPEASVKETINIKESR